MISLQFCVRGFFAGKSDVTKDQLTLVKNKNSNYFYKVLGNVFISFRVQILLKYLFEIPNSVFLNLYFRISL